MLTLNNVEVIFDNIILVLKGVSLEVPEGKLITLLGSNGAGKTTTLKAISALIKAERGQVTRGSIEFQGKRIDRLSPVAIVKNGIAQVFEGRRVFEHLNIRENLIAGAHINGNFREVNDDIDRVLTYFPLLSERLKVSAGYLSGGEQQMLAIGRALMAAPRVMLLDEPSIGLAPVIVREIFTVIAELAERGIAVLLVEQNARMALRVAARVYVLELGQVALSGTAQEIGDMEEVKRIYLAA